MQSINSISLRRANKLVLPDNDQRHQELNVSAAILATFNQNLQSIGYTLSPEVIKALRPYSGYVAIGVLTEALSILRELRGDKVTYCPMYPNFPAQVMEASAAELYLNAMVHYFTAWVSDVTGNKDVIWLPKYRKEAREPLDETVELTVIQLGTEADMRTIVTRIVTSNTSISVTDRADLKWLIEQGNGYFTLPEAIPNKENLAITGAIFINLLKTSHHRVLNEWFEPFYPFFKTATDILRLAVALSDGDVSLKDKTKFRQFRHAERCLLLALLEQCGSTRAEDMLRWEERWKRLGERLHPEDFPRRFSKAFASFQLLRNHPEQIRTFNSKVEAAVRSGDSSTAVSLLNKRPGEFARRLDHLFRGLKQHEKDRKEKQKSWQFAVDAFAEVATEISTPVLLQVMTHFKNRNNSAMRVVFPKGNVAKICAIPEQQQTLPGRLTDQIVIICEAALSVRFRTYPKLGKVYIDPQLQECLIPFSQRSASRSLRTLVRGSRLQFSDEKDTIRFFIYWKNQGENRVDLDLSALLYGAEWGLKKQIAYYDLRSIGFKASHSGDITDAPNGACEFIDVDIPSAQKHGVRYVVMDLRSFTGQKFGDLSVAFAGWMLREKPQSGEVFEPLTVVDRVDITMEATAGMPLILDLAERKVVWVDVATPRRPRRRGVGGNNALNNLDTIALIATAFTKIAKPNLYDLLALHAQARGKQVFTPRTADVVFSVEAGTPFELDKIASEFMPNRSFSVPPNQPPKVHSKAHSSSLS